ncbi:MAG: integrase arm-type DNA-binding domain-containing protein [Phyllobacteriaceae bacterium]|nr:integrase arm-type DNA-binding domain-containing protein [Phyllobacteriaceae bacterium]
MSLTDLSVGKLKPPTSGQITYYDDALPGFGVRVSQGGSKSFVVMYGKGRKRKTIGRYPAISLKDARIAAKQIQSEVATFDPHTATALPVPFPKALERFLGDRAAHTKPRTIAEYQRLLVRHFPFTKGMGDIKRSEVMRIVEGLQKTPTEQHHAFVAIRIMMNWCVRHGLIEDSPVPPVSFKKTARSRVLTDDELRRVWQRAAEFPYPFGPIVQLLILTGQRRSEIGSLRRSWIKDDMIVFPAGFTKNKREHRVPLGPKAKAILDSLPGGTDHFFPSRTSDDCPYNGWAKSKRVFDEPLGIEPYVLHDLRRTFSSKLAETGAPIHVTERILNHVSGTVSGVAAVYNRYSYSAEMLGAMCAMDNYLSSLNNFPRIHA